MSMVAFWALAAVGVGPTAPGLGEPLLSTTPAPHLQLRTSIPVGNWPKSVELTPDGRYAVVANLKSRNVMVVDTVSLKVVTTLAPPRFAPVESAFHPDGKRLVIAGGHLAHALFVFDLASWTLLAQVPGGRHAPMGMQTIYPKVVAFSPDGARLYAAYWRSRNIGIFDATSYRRLALLEVGERPRGIAITPDGTKGYVCLYGQRHRSLAAFRADQRFTLTKRFADLPNPRHLAMSAGGERAYVSLWGDAGGVAEIDTHADTVLRVVTGIGAESKTLKLSADERFIFVVNFRPGTLSIIDTTTFKEVARYNAGPMPQGLAISRDGRTVWTTGEGTVQVWDVQPAAAVLGSAG